MITKPKKGISWTEILTGMQIGQVLPADLEDRNTVAPLISRQLKYSHPDMKWETKKTSETTMDLIRTA